MNLINVDNVASLAKSDEYIHIHKPMNFRTDKLNEMLFFFKPEVFIGNSESVVKNIIDVVFEKMEKFDIDLSGVVLYSGKSLDDLGIMDKHYGYINVLSKSAANIVTVDEVKDIREKLGLNLSEKYFVMGGHEFLQKYSSYTAESLNALWLSKKSIKLRSGFYTQSFDVEGEKIILINGFHPMQLMHFTSPNHKIIAFLLHSNSSWRVLKDEFIGDTYPERAVPQSVRGYLYQNREEYEISKISVAENFVHLSAGPFEAFFEMYNFFSKYTPFNFRINDLNITHRLKENKFDDFAKIIQNPNVSLNGKVDSLFSFTENTDTDIAISKLLHDFLIA